MSFVNLNLIIQAQKHRFIKMNATIYIIAFQFKLIL